MIWLYDKALDSNKLCDFYQIFVNCASVYSDEEHNNIYSFESIDSHNLFEFNFDDYIYDSIKCEIKMIDNIISYNILTPDLNKKQIVFTFKMNFIEPNNNQYKIPIFKYSYKSINTKRLPNLIETEYNFSSIFDFKIYKLDKNNNIQFIIETNPITNLTRKYFITSDLNLINEFLKIKHNL